MFKNESVVFYVFVGFIIVICLKVYFESDTYNLKCIIATADGNRYCVRNREKLNEAQIY